MFFLPGVNLFFGHHRTIDQDKNRQRMDSKTNEKVSFTVAAKALGVSVKTIQRWVKSSKIQGIREDNRIFIPVDEIKIHLQKKRASIEDIDQDKKDTDQTNIRHSENKNIDVIPITRTHYEGLLTRLGQLEAGQQLLLEYKAGLEARNRELAETKSDFNTQAQELATVKSALNANNAELVHAKAVIEKARSELQGFLEVKQDAERKTRELFEQQSKLEAKEREIEELRGEVERLRLPWWKRLLYKNLINTKILLTSIFNII